MCDQFLRRMSDQPKKPDLELKELCKFFDNLSEESQEQLTSSDPYDDGSITNNVLVGGVINGDNVAEIVKEEPARN